MLFNSFTFLAFFSVFFILYWTFKSNYNFKIILIVISSYIFYGAWDYRFLSLIIFSSLVDFYCGKKIFDGKKSYLYISLFLNLGFLAYFKYCNFFIDSFNNLLEIIGFRNQINSLKIILPVGISFYTFQTLSYSLDIYKNKIKPETNLLTFMAFVSFFPQLVAGPIERASSLLPQLKKTPLISESYLREGLKLILFGLFKKVVIADQIAPHVNIIFEQHNNLSPFDLIQGAFLFALQIYGDFSGYSDIAIGISLLLGIRLMRNFRFPYFSRDIKEFWQRWHISLSSWFRDYLYIPIGGSRYGSKRTYINLTAVFVISGFWHGANFTFILWGLYHAILYLPYYFWFKQKKNDSNILSFFKPFLTFIIVTIGWIIFRSESINQLIGYLKNILIVNDNSIPYNIPMTLYFLILFQFVIEYLYNSKEYVFESNRGGVYKLARVLTYYTVLALIFQYSGDKSDFIYFQF